METRKPRATTCTPGHGQYSSSKARGSRRSKTFPMNLALCCKAYVVRSGTGHETDELALIGLENCHEDW